MAKNNGKASVTAAAKKDELKKGLETLTSKEKQFLVSDMMSLLGGNPGFQVNYGWVKKDMGLTAKKAEYKLATKLRKKLANFASSKDFMDGNEVDDVANSCFAKVCYACGHEVAVTEDEELEVPEDQGNNDEGSETDESADDIADMQM